MSAEIITLPTAIPDATFEAGPDEAYVLELEHENAELRDIIARGELGRWRSRTPMARRAILAAVVMGAFVTGWVIDPPPLDVLLGLGSPAARASAKLPALYAYGCRVGV